MHNNVMSANRMVNELVEDCNGDYGRALVTLALDMRDMKKEIKRNEEVHKVRLNDLGYLISKIGSLRPQGDSGHNAINLIDAVETLVEDIDGLDSDLMSPLEDIKERLILTVQLKEREEHKYNCRC